MRFLLTGFEPFGQFPTNPSWDALKLAADTGLLPQGACLARLPVSYAATYPAFEAAVREHRPEAALSFGLHGGMHDRAPNGIYIETIARNRDGASKADNDGEARPAQPIVQGAPDELQATYPALELVKALQEEGYRAGTHTDAGGYLCNHLFYRAAHHFGAGFPYGFVHVPPVDNMGGVLTLNQLAHAVAIMANTMAAAVTGKRS